MRFAAPALLLATFAAGSATASEIRYAFTATVTGQNYGYAVGQIVHGSFTYDAGLVCNAGCIGSEPSFGVVAYFIQADVPLFSAFQGSAGEPVFSGLNRGNGVDARETASQTSYMMGAQQWASLDGPSGANAYFYLTLVSSDPHLLDATVAAKALGPLPALAAFDVSAVLDYSTQSNASPDPIAGERHGYRATITAMAEISVPEPTSALVLAPLLGALAGLRRRR